MPETANRIPLVEYLVLGDKPHLRAHACGECGALYFDRRNACARCGRRSFAWRDLETTGTVRAFTIVHRAAPKVPAPYISVVVALDGGGIVKSNLVDVPIEPASIPAGLRVGLTTYVAATDDDDTEAIAFGFSPMEER